MTKEQVIRRLIKEGFGLPKAISIYNELSCGGFHEVEKIELAAYIKKNGF